MSGHDQESGSNIDGHHNKLLGSQSTCSPTGGSVPMKGSSINYMAFHALLDAAVEELESLLTTRVCICRGL